LMMDKLIGAHVSAAGGIYKSVDKALAIGANAFALFPKNQLQWTAKPYTDEDIERFRSALSGSGIPPAAVLPHSAYLINLGAPDPAVARRSRDALLDELKRVEQLGLFYLNFHPGSSKGEISDEACISQIAGAMDSILAETTTAKLVLETTAGQGANLGWHFDHLARIIDEVSRSDRVGVCIDTAHVFGAGYDIRDAEGWDATMERFEAVIGIERLVGMHLNDSKMPLGSRKDRHATIGNGEVGLSAFEAILADSRTDNIPLILETPEPDRWAEEIEMLRGMATAGARAE
jgi:deoxyribonuclease IV